MKISILVDNNTLIDRYFLGEPGASYYIEDEDTSILFDTGYSNVFIKNAQKMGIDLLNLDFIVLSHGHLDHTWGLTPLIKLRTTSIFHKKTKEDTVLITHPKALLPKSIAGEDIGSLLSQEELEKHFKLRLSSQPIWLTKKLVYLGEIPRTNDFEAKKPIGRIITPEYEEDDYLLDDSSLAYKANEGLVIITGCSHAGICNIINQAKQICNEERIKDIVGGLHLLNPSQNHLTGTGEFIKSLNLNKIHPCHCTDFHSKAYLSKFVKIGEVGVGLALNYD